MLVIMVGIDYEHFAAPNDLVIWRYMSLDRLQALVHGHLYFPSARQFSDPFEGAITDAERIKRLRAVGVTRLSTGSEGSIAAFEELRRLMKISCWYGSLHENIAMWERYGPMSAVAVASSVESLKLSLHEFRLRPEYGEEEIKVGRVRYINYASDVMEYQSMEAHFMYKRIEFRDEQEIRALLSLRMTEEFGASVPELGVSVDLNPQELIHEIRVWPTATEGDVTNVQAMINAAEIWCPVTRSTLGHGAAY